MSFLKQLLGMMVLYVIILVIAGVVKIIRDQQWYKNIQRINPLKKPYIIIGVSLLIVVVLIVLFVMGDDRDKDLIAGMVAIFAISGLVIISGKSKEKKYYNYLKDNFKTSISDYKAYEPGIKLLYLHTFPYSRDFFQELYSKTPTKAALYHICVIDIFLKQNRINSSIEILEKMITDKEVSTNFGDIYFALAMAYEKMGNEIKREHYSKIAERQSEGYFHKIFTWDRVSSKKSSENKAKKAWKFAINEKILGKSNFTIFSELQQMGIGNEYAYHIVNNLRSKAEELMEDSKINIRTAIGTIITGVISICISFSVDKFYVFAFTIVAIGVTNLIKSLVKQSKISNVLRILSEDSNSVNDKVYAAS